MRDVKVLIGGTSRLGRGLVARRLSGIGQDVRVVAEATTIETIIMMVRRHCPDIVVLLDEADAEQIGAIRASSPRSPQVVLAPEQAPTESNLQHVAAVLPRDKYTPRAMTLALSRVVARV